MGAEMNKKLKKILKEEDIIFGVCCLITAGIFAAYRCNNGDFVAFNGDFQNYNIFRRLMDHQTQYTDFVNYLGNGMIWVNYPLLLLFQSFGSSVFITNFTASLMYQGILFVTLYVSGRNKKVSYVLTSLIGIGAFLILHLGWSSSFYYTYVYNVVYFEELGHSMRTTRAALPFLVVAVLVLCRVYEELWHVKWKLAVCFVTLGALTIWSNDYGYSSVVCFGVILVLMCSFQEQMDLSQRICRYVLAGSSALLGMLLMIAMITKGHPGDYFAVTKGITEYQFWYYGNMYGKFLTLQDFFADKMYVFLTIVFWMHALWFLVRCVKQKIQEYDVYKLYLHSTCYLASVVYAIGSGAHNYSALELVTYLFAANVIGKTLYRIVKQVAKKNYIKQLKQVEQKTVLFYGKCRKNSLPVWILTMLVLYCISINMIRVDADYRGRTEMKQMEVSSVIGQGVEEVAQKLEGKDIFSTYASAIETTNQTFQPTGTDYIIHVLGDASREKYINQFQTGNYEYVTTLKNDYTVWEYWASRVNWFFYRELYTYYEPSDETLYSVIWKRSDVENTVDTEVKLSWEYLDKATCKITVELPEYTKKAAYVDLSVSYTTMWTQERLREGALRKVVCVQDGGEQYNSYQANSCYYLPEKAEHFTIPVYIRNGEGYVYLSSYPIACTTLTEVHPVVERVIKEPEYALHVTRYTDIDRSLAEDGVNEEGTLLKFDNTEFHRTILDNTEYVKAGEECGTVDSIWTEGNYIYVSLQNAVDGKAYEYPADIRVVKRKKTYTALDYSDEQWVCGVSRKEGCILMDSEIDIENLWGIKVGTTMKKIARIEKMDQGYCLHMVDNYGVQMFAYPQELQLVYRE